MLPATHIFPTPLTFAFALVSIIFVPWGLSRARLEGAERECRAALVLATGGLSFQSQWLEGSVRKCPWQSLGFCPSDAFLEKPFPGDFGASRGQ